MFKMFNKFECWEIFSEDIALSSVDDINVKRIGAII